MIKVSVIVPVYNVENYLRRCIESLLNQTLSDIEVILIDDGSTDHSGEYCDQYLFNYKVKIVHTPNGGVSAARNRGIECAQGEYITFVDPDDYLDLDCLEYLYELAKTQKVDIVCYKMMIHKESNILRKNNKEKLEYYKNTEIIDGFCKDYRFGYSSCNKLYKSRLIKDIRFPEGIKDRKSVV